MCGITGIVELNGGAVDERVLQAMTDAIAHRGPDGEGRWVDGGVGLGNRRLAILDRTPAGNQPMTNAAGDLVIVYNGEVYNFRELREELEACGCVFRSHTDTEVVLYAYERWGRSCVDRLNGMFAFAICDRREGGGLFLARDRYGIKPLYYWRGGETLLFASEVKALLEHPRVSTRVCPQALSEYFTFQNILSDATLFDGVRLLPAGCTLWIDPRARTVTERRYWDYQFAATSCSCSFEEASDEVYRRFEQAVVRQLVSDVPVGAYLSGGMDSGSIVAVAARHLGRMRTFTGGFDLSSASGLEMGFDERAASERTANRFKTEHYEMVLHAGDMEHVLPELVWHLEDLRVGQCYPNYYIAGLAGRFVGVVLSGTGGDELFAGYPWRYYRATNGATTTDGYYNYWQRLVPDQDRASFFNGRTYAEVRQFEPREAFRQAFGEGPRRPCSIEDVVDSSLRFEIRTFLHGLLIVEDKLSMAHSLETRVPFLDNDLVDFAMALPPRFKLRDLEHAPVVDEDEAGKRTRYRLDPTADGKIVLRQAMSRLIPSDVTAARKQGFAAPDASWFAGESIEYVRQLLGPRTARLYDFVDPDYVARVIDEHTRAQINHRLLIWSLLSFEWWCRCFLK